MFPLVMATKLHGGTTSDQEAKISPTLVELCATFSKLSHLCDVCSDGPHEKRYMEILYFTRSMLRSVSCKVSCSLQPL